MRRAIFAKLRPSSDAARSIAVRTVGVTRRTSCSVSCSCCMKAIWGTANFDTTHRTQTNAQVWKRAGLETQQVRDSDRRKIPPPPVKSRRGPKPDAGFPRIATRADPRQRSSSAKRRAALEHGVIVRNRLRCAPALLARPVARARAAKFNPIAAQAQLGERISIRHEQ